VDKSGEAPGSTGSEASSVGGVVLPPGELGEDCSNVNEILDAIIFRGKGLDRLDWTEKKYY